MTEDQLYIPKTGLHMRGTGNHRAKLNEDQVREIRSSSKKTKQLCKDFGVTPSTIYAIKAGELWTHLD